VHDAFRLRDPARFAAAGTVALGAPVAHAAPPAAPGTVPIGAIGGRVTDAATGRPIRGVEVRIWYSESFVTSTVTGANGRYYYVSTFNHAGYVDEAYDDQICVGDTCEPPFDTPVIVPAGGAVRVDFALDRGGAVSGTVRAAATGAPVSGLDVYLELSAIRTPVRADGSFRIDGLPPGSTGSGPSARGRSASPTSSTTESAAG
jgi:hypothetical protein